MPPPPDMREGGEVAKLTDPDTGAELRIVEWEGSVYFELVTSHDGVRVANLLRAPRDIAVPTIRRVFT
jgi:hypothetical protein